ncbi:response regulator transcription factor [Vogesella indigofera]|uniref:response regulator transcription factor n=1 Tax=Vogesella indigofera TaxID=45465 RepID=UPI00234EA940|nr:response regulator transcription factor [Vogesella indigofera]MDC7710540.1 response regulator transcription factor [Vogesella indigofera]
MTMQTQQGLATDGADTPLRVFAISDFPLLLAALATLLAAQAPRLALAGTAAATPSPLDALAAADSDVVLLDLDGDAEPTLALIRALAARGGKVLLLTRQQERALQDRAIMLGARGLLTRDSDTAQLLTAIEKVHHGQLWLDRDATGRIFGALSRQGGMPLPDAASVVPPPLSEQEKKIVAILMANSGEPAKLIAGKLHISESTLRNHLTVIYKKFGVSNRHGLLGYVLQHGLLLPA